MRKVVTLIACVLVFTGGVWAQTSPKVHQLKATTQTVHRGFFDASLKPVLTINSGDIVKLETATGNPRYFERLGVPKDRLSVKDGIVSGGGKSVSYGDLVKNQKLNLTISVKGDLNLIARSG